MTGWIVSSSILILVVTAMRYILLGRLSPRLQYAAWAAVALRLLIPFSFFNSALSVMNFVRPVEKTAFVDVMNYKIPVMSFDEAYSQVVDEYEAGGVDVSALEGSELEALDYEAYSLMQGQSLGAIAKKAALYLWLAGAVFAALAMLISNLIFSHKLKHNRKSFTAYDCALPVYICDSIETSCMFGLIKPSVYITPEVSEDETMLQHVMAHEMTHCRHLDHIWSFVRCLCLILHWYNPLVWAAAKLSRRDAEIACDEGAIQKLGDDSRAEYGRTLISLTTHKHKGMREHISLPTAMAGGKRTIYERIRLIANKPSNASWLIVSACVILALAVGCSFTGADDKTVFPEDAVYVSSECLYMNPLSSFAAIDGDSGCEYAISDSSFIIITRESGNVTSIAPESWEWLEFPYTESEWQDMFVFSVSSDVPVDVSYYTEKLYLPLSDDLCLFSMDSELWLVEKRENYKLGTYIWSIFSLVSKVSD